MSSRRICACAVLPATILLLCESIAPAQERVLSRDELVARLTRNVRFAGDLSRLDDSEKARVGDLVIRELRIQAPGIFPEELSARSTDIMERLVAPAVQVTNDDPEYISAKTEVWLRSINLAFAFQTRVEPRAPEAREAIRANIADLRKAAEPIMLSALSGHFTQAEIAQHLDAAERTWMSRADNPLTIEYRVPLPPGGMATLLAEFQDRLEESVDRIPIRLGNTDLIHDQEARDLTISRRRNAILNEITSAAFAVLGKRTIDPALAAVDRDALEPGLAGSIEKLVAVEQRLALARRQTLERNRQTAASRVAAEVAEDLHRIDPAAELAEEAGEDVQYAAPTAPLLLGESTGRHAAPHGDADDGGSNRAAGKLSVAVVLAVAGVGAIVFWVVRRRRR